MAGAGLMSGCVKSQVTELCRGVIRRSPVFLHAFITKRYIEFNFSQENPFEGAGKAFSKSGVCVYALCH
jgi:hypothetical protein